MSPSDYDDHDHKIYHTAVLKVLDLYSSFGFAPQHSQYTVLASFFLIRSGTTDIKVISLGTGTKCLPANRLSPKGEIVNDSHAEVLARRSAVLWFLEEIQRICSVDAYRSPWLDHLCSDGRYSLRDGVKLNLYISTVPCGDASMRILASVQDKEMASLKDNAIFPPLDPSTASRGRDDYSRLGVLRTKPGRADSPPTLSMSCSDKIAKWIVLGIQGALSFHFLHPLHISNIVIGEVPVDMQTMVREDCERAFWKRLDGIQEDFRVLSPTIYFTALPFTHSRSVLTSNGSCNESLCWTADSQPFEILINGLKRGVSPKHRYREKARPRVSRIALLHSYDLTLVAQKKPSLSNAETYLQLKLSASGYQTAKETLMGKSGPFTGWLISGSQWQGFNRNGEPP